MSAAQDSQREQARVLRAEAELAMAARSLTNAEPGSRKHTRALAEVAAAKKRLEESRTWTLDHQVVIDR